MSFFLPLDREGKHPRNKKSTKELRSPDALEVSKDELGLSEGHSGHPHLSLGTRSGRLPDKPKVSAGQTGHALVRRPILGSSV